MAPVAERGEPLLRVRPPQVEGPVLGGGPPCGADVHRPLGGIGPDRGEELTMPPVAAQADDYSAVVQPVLHRDLHLPVFIPRTHVARMAATQLLDPVASETEGVGPGGEPGRVRAPVAEQVALRAEFGLPEMGMRILPRQ